jgi:hypothetical protein
MTARPTTSKSWIAVTSQLTAKIGSYFGRHEALFLRAAEVVEKTAG